jgi:hypothetical protein
MSDRKPEGPASVKERILSVLRRIRAKPSCRKLLSPDFSLSLNSVGEPFVDLLLQRERKGRRSKGFDTVKGVLVTPRLTPP